MTPPEVRDGEIVRPHASSLIESLRAVGYSLETALADIIDNSISAGARNIAVTIAWDDSEPFIGIVDDGSGMTESELIEAMRIGARNPLESRGAKELGRFGLGLKTASFSQCRSVSVITRTGKSEAVARRWDLDFISRVNEWRLCKDLSPAGTKYSESLDARWRTVVIWEKLDRLFPSKQLVGVKGQDYFYKKIAAVEAHLSMVFHRFLVGPKKIAITLNEAAVAPWDPFMTGELASQTLPREIVQVPGGTISVVPHVLPHKSKISPSAYERAEGIKGLIDQQGFYVYRNNRLLVAGHWLGLGFRKREQYSLARIQVDLTNEMDADWQIDIMKARASPPASAREHLARIARWTAERSADVMKGRKIFLSRGGSEDFVYTWIPVVSHGRTRFRINRQHPLISHLMDSPGIDKKSLNSLLSVIEDTVPVDKINLTGSETEESATDESVLSRKEILESAAAVFKLLALPGMASAELKEKLLQIEPFYKFPQIVDDLVADYFRSIK